MFSILETVSDELKANPRLTESSFYANRSYGTESNLFKDDEVKDALLTYNVDNTNRVIKFWEQFGFLAGLNGFAKIKCALYMDAVSCALIKQGFNHADYKVFSGMIYPVIRRLNPVTTPFNIDSILNEFFHYTQDFSAFVDAFGNHPDGPYDVEAEGVAAFCNMVYGRELEKNKTPKGKK